MVIDILTLLWLIPLFGAVVLLLLPVRGGLTRVLSLIFSSVVFAISLILFIEYKGEGFEYEYSAEWLKELGISYTVGADGIALLMVMLTGFLMTMALFSSFKEIKFASAEGKGSEKGFYVCMLILESALVGVFISLDLILFFIFWEAVLIPMYLIINIYGSERRVYASTKFIIYTMVGSLFLLAGLIYIGVENWRSSGILTFDYVVIKEFCADKLAGGWELVYVGLLIAFCIKLPAFPFHTWLPDAHTEAPTGGSVILAGVLLKMGGFGLIRYCLELFPKISQEYAMLLVVLGVVNIFYGAIMSYVQTDIKRLVAYSSVSHMGYVLIGCFSLSEIGLKGGGFQMVSHGITTGGLFIVVGMLYERFHTRAMEKYGGLAGEMKNLSLFMMILVLSAMGLPGLSGFVGEFFSLVGLYKFNLVLTIISAGGALLSAVYMLRFYQKIMFGERKFLSNNFGDDKIKDLSFREFFILAVMTVLILYLGVSPSSILRVIF